MSKFKNYSIALLLTCALALPVLAQSTGSISSNAAEEVPNKVAATLTGENGAWAGKNVEVSENCFVPEAKEVVLEGEEEQKAIGAVSEEFKVNSEEVHVVTGVDASVKFVATEVGTDTELSYEITDFKELTGGNDGYTIRVEIDLSKIPAQEENMERVYFLVRFHENSNGDTEIDVLPGQVLVDADNDQAILLVSSDKFSRFAFGYSETPRKVSPSTPQEAPAIQNNDKPVASYDDGGPFTTDACGNVFDRWGNEIYHAPVCVNESAPTTNNGYQFVNTLDK